MKNFLMRLIILSTFISFTIQVMAQTELEKLAAENERLTLEKVKITLEKEIAEAKAKLTETEALSSVKLSKDLAEAQKAEAEAVKAEYAAKIPSTKLEPLTGAIAITTTGNIGIISGVRSLDEVAKEICKTLEQREPIKPIMIYEPTVIAGIVSARQLESSLNKMTEYLNDALSDIEPSATDPHLMSLPLAVGAASGSLKALADLASIFKTDMTITATPIPDSKSLFLASLGSHCADNISNIGFGYKGELNMDIYNKLMKNLDALSKGNHKLHLWLVDLKNKMDGDKTFQKANQNRYNDLASLEATIDDFIKKLKPEDFSSTSPISIAASYLQIAKNTDESEILEIDVKTDAMTILKSNIFTGQTLRISNSSIIAYKLYDRDGKLKAADIITKIDKPIKINLRIGRKADSSFYAKKNSAPLSLPTYPAIPIDK